MLSLVTPHLYLASVLEIRTERLCAIDRRGLLLDLDCTLKDYDSDHIGSTVLKWAHGLRMAGVRMCLLSNGRPGRVKRFAEELQVPFVAKAFKPLPFGCKAALREIGLPAEQSAIVGDQVFADILAGRLAGLFTILVPPTSPVEPMWTRVKRPFERRVLKWVVGKDPTNHLGVAANWSDHATISYVGRSETVTLPAN